MRITHLIASRELTAVERHLIGLLGGLQSRDVMVDLLILGATQGVADAVVKTAAAAGIAARGMALPGHLSSEFVAPLADHIRTQSPDIVHVHGSLAGQYGSPAARRAGGRPVIATCYDATQSITGLGFRLLTRQFGRIACHTIAISEYVRAAAIAQGVPPEQITLIPCGIAPEQVRVGQGARMVLAAEIGIPQSARLVGIFCPLEAAGGVEEVLKAFWIVSVYQTDAHLLFVGDGILREALVKQARGYRIDDRVHFLGRRRDVPAILSALDVLVLPCLRDDQALLLLEAVALETPVIATAAGSVPEVLTDGQNGLLIPPGDLANLASALSLLLGDPDFGRMLASAAKARLEADFSFDHMIDETLAVYRGIDAR